MKPNQQQQIELEAQAFRKLVAHLQARHDVQNLDMMNLTGFCRNCLGNWVEEAAKEKGLDLSRAEARAQIYGMSQEDWKAKYQTGETVAITKPQH